MNIVPEPPFPNAYWVRPGRLMAGPYPGGWSEDRADERVRQLVATGIDHVIDLTEPREMPAYLLRMTTEAARHTRTIAHRRYPIRDMDVPAREHTVIILDAIDAALAEGRTVYVHCVAGLGRTGTVVGCFLVRHGMDGQMALDMIGQLRRGSYDSPQTDEQQRYVRTWPEGGNKT